MADAPRAPGTPRSRRGGQTRAAIFEAALALFGEHGYEATTMRAIADRAGVSLGTSYHYFPSKGHLVLEYYAHLHRLHRAACVPLLARERELGARLRGVVRAIVMTCEPFHSVAASLFSVVADPSSPLSPFGPQSAALRREVIELYAEVLRGSDARVQEDVAQGLPRLLWLYQMGVLYFWMADRSPGRLHTLELIDETSDLVVRLLSMANLPPLRTSRRRVLSLLRSLTDEEAPSLPGAAGTAEPGP